jgi:hypothetical protein
VTPFQQERHEGTTFGEEKVEGWKHGSQEGLLFAIGTCCNCSAPREAVNYSGWIAEREFAAIESCKEKKAPAFGTGEKKNGSSSGPFWACGGTYIPGSCHGAAT